MHAVIRSMQRTEYGLLEKFLYEAIFIPAGMDKPPKEIIQNEELQVYIQNFGAYKGDNCLVAEVSGEIVGVCWTRLMRDYGYVDAQTPSFAIALYEQYRGHGIGTELMRNMLTQLRLQGYRQASLAVQKENYAVKMYQKLGFQTIRENEQEYIMLCPLNQ